MFGLIKMVDNLGWWFVYGIFVDFIYYIYLIDSFGIYLISIDILLVSYYNLFDLLLFYDYWYVGFFLDGIKFVVFDNMYGIVFLDFD